MDWDANRCDHTNRTAEHVKRGFAVINVEIPGTGDCPAAKHDPKSPDRLFSSVLDRIAVQDVFDGKNVAARGVSTGGYYTMRVAHTPHDGLLGVVSQCGGSHHIFDQWWIAAQDKIEYPFALAEALAFKFGYQNVEAYRTDDAQKRFSLFGNGFLDMRCTRLLVLNGIEDEIFPLEGSILALRHWRVKYARFLDGAKHMGNPAGDGIQYDWIDGLLKA